MFLFHLFSAFCKGITRTERKGNLEAEKRNIPHRQGFHEAMWESESYRIIFTTQNLNL